MKDDPAKLKIVPAPVKNEGVAKRKSVRTWFMGIKIVRKTQYTTAITEVAQVFFCPMSASEQNWTVFYEVKEAKMRGKNEVGRCSRTQNLQFGW